MIEQLLAVFGTKCIHTISMVTGIASQIIKSFEQQFPQDINAKKAAIDALILLLQEQKSSCDDIAKPAQ